MKSRGLKANLVFNVIGPVFSLVVLVVATPIYISYIGNARYGLLSITWRLLGYFGFIDLGLSRASANALAKLNGPSSGPERAKVLITSLWINLGLGIVGGLIFYFTGIFFVEHLLDVPAELKPEISAAFPWIACMLPLALIGGLGYGALESRERFLAANILQVIGSTAGVAVPVICSVYISPSLSVVIPAAVISRVLSVLMALAFALRSEGFLNPRMFDWKQARALLRYGSWITVSGIISPLMASVDQLTIGSVLSVAAVAFYAVPMSLVVRSQLLAGALSRTLFPRLSRSTREEASELARKALVTLAYAYGAICAAAMVMTRPVIEFWMGKDFGAVAAPIGELLLFGAYINGLAFIFYALLQGQGRPDALAKVDSFLIIPYLTLLWALVSHAGLLGAAASWDLMVFIEAGFLFAIARFHPSRLIPLLPPFGIIAATYVYVLLLPPPALTALFAAGFVAAGTCAAAMLFDAYSRNFILSLGFLERWRRVA